MSEPTLVAGAATNRGPRPANEDAYLVPTKPDLGNLGALYAVADGVGGQSEGAQASRLAIKVMNESFYHYRQSGQDVPTALQTAVQEANGAVYNAAQARGGEAMGTTLVAAVIHQQHLFLAHVGDARAYLLGGKKLRLLTKDHSWVQEQVDAGTLTPAEAARHDLRNIVTRVLGNKPDVVPELSGPIALQAGDTILLCSDGLYDVLDARGLQRYLSNGDPEMAALNLVQAAITAGTGDNITAVVLHWIDRKNAVGEHKRTGRLLPIILALLALGAIALFLGTRPSSSTEEVTVGAPTLPATFVAPMRTTTPPPETTSIQKSHPCGYTWDLLLCPSGPPSASIDALPSASIDAPPSTDDEAQPSTDPDVSQSTGSSVPPKKESVKVGCVTRSRPRVNLWTDSQLENDGNLCQNTDFWFQETQVEILSDLANPKEIFGQGINGSCIKLDFVKVRTFEDPPQEGWVWAGRISALDDGEQQCP